MPLTANNWTLDAYTTDVWTDLVAEVATLTTVIIANTTASPIPVSVRVADAGVKQSTVLPITGIAAYGSYTLDMRSLNITGTQGLQILASAAGLEFTASGAV